MPRAYPEEFRRDVVEIARRNETPIAQIAKDFGISDAVIRRWLAKADIEDGLKPVTAAMESAELREANKGSANSTFGNVIDGVWLTGVVIEAESRPPPAILKPIRQ